ncbi:MAG: hypothetical protein MJ215_05860 [Spirochaetia bacterium]|nr:hypothetical protein [Spirochaetia bacterium]
MDSSKDNFFIPFEDRKNDSYINKIVFNKDKNGNYTITVGKIRKVHLKDTPYKLVGIGIAPTIYKALFPRLCQPTGLAASITNSDFNISHPERKSTITKSVKERVDEILKSNPNHDELGRFASCNTEKSSEVRHDGEFVLTKNGSKDFGEISEEFSEVIKRQAGKIRLQLVPDNNADFYDVKTAYVADKNNIRNKLNKQKIRLVWRKPSSLDLSKSLVPCYPKSIASIPTGLIKGTSDNFIISRSERKSTISKSVAEQVNEILHGWN